MILPVVLSGGSGARLWPRSRAMYPKQFIRFFDGQGSLLGATLRRLGNKPGFERPIVVCNADHRFLVRDELANAGIEPLSILVEPKSRNTTAAVAAAVAFALSREGDANLAILPSDHLIKDAAAFREYLVRAAEVARDSKLVLLGTKPAAPHTSYGYIRRGEVLPDGASVVRSFREKPPAICAAQFANDPDYLWNSGIIVAGARTLAAAIEKHEPAIWSAACAAVANATNELAFQRLDTAVFAGVHSLSIETSVLEKTEEAVVLAFDFEWGEVSSWSTLWESSPQDAAGNSVEGDAMLLDTSRSLIHSDRSLVATIGVDDLIIVDTPDALLVADRSRAEEVSGIVARLGELSRTEHVQHIRSYRPWGYFETLNLGPRFQVKLLHVDPGQRLSMQMHHHRSEHWVVVCGAAKVTIGDREMLVRENESVYVGATVWHRLENPGKVALEIIEVQLGSYLGENDIVRTDDIYNRAADETR